MSNKQTTIFEGDVYIAASLDPSIYGTGNLNVDGDLTVTGNFAIGSVAHGGLSGLDADDHLQYALLVGRTGGQILLGGTAASNSLTLRSTSNATKGSIILDETTSSTSSATGALRLAGGLGISNTTNATSSTNGGSFTTAGGMAVAQSLFVGTAINLNSLTASQAVLTDAFKNLVSVATTGSGNVVRATSPTLVTPVLGAASATTLSLSDYYEVTDISAPASATAGKQRFYVDTLDSLLKSKNSSGNITIYQPATTKGDIISHNGTIQGRLAVGTDGQVLIADSTQTFGLRWGTGGGGGVSDHGDLTGLADDDHAQYALLAGRTGGQILTGGIAASNTLTLRSTSNATKGSIILDETTSSTSSITGALRLAGGLGISNATNATSSTNGGSFTTAGGMAVAQSLFVGTAINLNSLTASQVVFTDASKNLVSVATTGSGNVVLATSPTLVTPVLGVASGTSLDLTGTTASTSSITGVLTIDGGLGISNTTNATSSTNGGSFTTAGGMAIAQSLFVGTAINLNSLTASQVVFTDASKNLVSVGTTGSGNVVRATSPTLVTPVLGVASGTSLDLTGTTASSSSITGVLTIDGGLGISNTTNATSSTNGGSFTTAGGMAVGQSLFVGTAINLNSLTASQVVFTDASKNLVSVGTSGSGNVVLATSPTLVTPVLGAASATSVSTNILTVNDYYEMTDVTAPGSATAGKQRFYVDNLDSLLKSKNSSGNVTIYQPANTKGDLVSHNGTTQGKVPVGTDGQILIADSTQTFGLRWGSAGAATSHGSLSGLEADDHLQYALLSGRSGGQILTGGTAASNTLTLRSTSNATKGSIILDETTSSTSSTTGVLRLAGGLGISNATNASSSTNGGSFTTAGGMAVAQSLFVGTAINLNALTASQAVFTDASKNLVSVATTGSGNVVRATSPTLVTPVLGVASGTSLDLTGTTASTSSITGVLTIDGGLGISITTNATSSTNGGSFTTAGGMAVAQSLFVGTAINLNSLTASQVVFTDASKNLVSVGTTGSGNVVLATSPSLVTPVLGAASATSITTTTATVNDYYEVTNISAPASATAGKQRFYVDTVDSLLKSKNSSGNITVYQPTTTKGDLLSHNGTLQGRLPVGTDGQVLVADSTQTFGLRWGTGAGGGVSDHGALTGLADDDHVQYALLAGRSGGQILTGGTDASSNLTLRSTSSATKGSVILDETTSSTSSTTGALRLSGGIGISNATDATSSTNGGSFTTAGGMAVAQSLFVGTAVTTPIATINNYYEVTDVAAPASATAGKQRFYVDTTDSLLKSKSSAGTITTYQPTTTKGDLLSHDATTQGRVPVGTNGQVLLADSTQTFGLRWGNKVYAYIRDEKTIGTNGGTFTNGAWRIRDLNTATYYPTSQTSISLAANVITLQAGIYLIEGRAPGMRVDAHKTRVFDVTNNVSLITGSNADNSLDNMMGTSSFTGIITIAAQTDIRVEHRCETTRPSGFGLASGIDVEVYTQIFITKLA